MIPLFVFFIFLFGLAVGSFLNVLIWRLPREEKISGRSKCPKCKKVLTWYELIPLFSFLWQGGKCRSCHKRISFQYPLVELTAGLFFVFVFYNWLGSFGCQMLAPYYSEGISAGSNVKCQMSSLVYPAIPELLFFLFVVSVLIAVFVTDLRYYIIPDKIVFPAIGIVLLYNLFQGLEFRILNLDIVSNLEFRISDFRPLVDNQFIGPILAGFLVSSFFFSLVLASRGRWMGMGDVKFAFFMGLLLGFPNIFVATFFAFMSGAICGIILIIAGKRSFQSQLPFGTFLAASTFVALFWGDQLFNLYWDVIL